MAFARFAFRTLLILLVLLLLIGMLLPSSARVERSILINASADNIFSHINGMRAFHAWSPWSDIDPGTQYEFTGPTEGVGSRMSWQSTDSEVGRGTQEIVNSVPNQRVDTQLEFGDQGGGQASFVLEPSGEATRLSWQFETQFGWDLFGRYVGLMIGSMVGASYEKGLQQLKDRVEQATASNSTTD